MKNGWASGLGWLGIGLNLMKPGDWAGIEIPRELDQSTCIKMGVGNYLNAPNGIMNKEVLLEITIYNRSPVQSFELENFHISPPLFPWAAFGENIRRFGRIGGCLDGQKTSF